jgi:hypothetical protein
VYHPSDGRGCFALEFGGLVAVLAPGISVNMWGSEEKLAIFVGMK